MTRGHIIAVAFATVVIVGLVFGGLFLLGQESGEREGADVGLPSGDETTSNPEDVPDEPVDITEPTTLTPAPGADQRPAGRIAYRFGGAIWVADEDGSNSVRVIDSSDGPYALSPDGETLAISDSGLGRLLVVAQVTTTEDRDAGLVDVGPAAPEQPSWAPDSSWFAYTANTEAGAAVHTARRNGDGDARIDAGHGPSVSPDGKRIAYIDATETGGEGLISVHTVDTGLVREVSGPEAIEVDWVGGFILYSTPGDDGASPALATVSPLGVNHKLLVGPPSASRPVLYTRLCVSVDHKYIAYAHTGDDGYSRVFVIEVDEPEPVGLYVRRDNYPMCWTADSARLFFIEGNPFQGETMDLMSVQPDGMGRRVVVEGVDF